MMPTTPTGISSRRPTATARPRSTFTTISTARRRRTGSILRQRFSTISYSYDLAGDLLSASAPAAADTFSYNNVGQAASTTQQIAGPKPTVTLTQQFDADGNRTQLAATVGETADFVNNYAYDSLGGITQVTQPHISGGNAVAEKRVDLAYDANGQYNTIPATPTWPVRNWWPRALTVSTPPAT